MTLNKFVIIGQSNTGKSCLFDEIVEDRELRPIGFRIQDLEDYHNNVPVQTSLRKGKQRIQLKEVYDTFGVQCLKNVLQTDREEYDCIVLDELGRGEDTSPEFAKYINKILDSDNTVFILMKNINNKVTAEIKKRRDVLLYDLDNMSQDEVLRNIEEKL